MKDAPDWQVVQVHREAPAKPAWGAPCNGCGVCCLVAPCPVGMVVSRKRRGACVALRWSAPESRYRCGMVSDTLEVLGPRWRWGARWLMPWIAPWISRLARRWISAGSGCDSTLEVPNTAAPSHPAQVPRR